MSSAERDKPWGRASSPLTYTNRDGEQKTRWVRCGSVYRNQDGSLRLVLDTIPAHWFRQQPEVVFFKEDDESRSRRDGGRNGGNSR